MKVVRRINQRGNFLCHCFALYIMLCCIISDPPVVSVKCENESKQAINRKEIFTSREYQPIIEENSRSKRATTNPATGLFDELLGQRLFNTTMNFIVPGAKVHLPRHTEEGSVDHLAMQAFFGIFWAATWIAATAIPLSLTYFRPLGIGRSLDDEQNEGQFNWKLNEKLAESIGLSWRGCMQNSVCQAHQQPEKYGFLGQTIRTLFPTVDNPTYNGDIVHQMGAFHQAALNGAIGHDCDHIYKCFFDTLDVILYVKQYCFATLSNGL